MSAFSYLLRQCIVPAIYCAHIIEDPFIKYDSLANIQKELI